MYAPSAEDRTFVRARRAVETQMPVNWTEETIGSGPQALRIRIYRPERDRAPVVVLHLHGGTFIDGSLEKGLIVPTLLADAGAVAVSIGYPHAPKHRFPHALQVAFGALKWLHKNRTRWASRKSRLLVAGEEAGGNLAAGLALMARDQQMPRLDGQILLSPMLDPQMATCSMRRAEAGPVGCKWADGWHEYLGSAEQASHPYAAPVMSSRLAGLAPALVLTAEDDLLRDETLCYAQRVRAAGVNVDEHVLPAPTGWPCALSGTALVDAPWMATVRKCFAAFFSQTLAALPQPALEPTKA
jgi:acetyl esterase/lipase